MVKFFAVPFLMTSLLLQLEIKEIQAQVHILSMHLLQKVCEHLAYPDSFISSAVNIFLIGFFLASVYVREMGTY